jgi:hypothetical protein
VQLHQFKSEFFQYSKNYFSNAKNSLIITKNLKDKEKKVILYFVEEK